MEKPKRTRSNSVREKYLYPVTNEDATTRKRDRIRLLNVIYFVDSHKTRSFKLSLRTAYWLAGISTVILLWSLVSLFILGGLYTKLTHQHLRAIALSDIIYNYQSTYESVYEHAYPSPKNANHEMESLAPELAQLDEPLDSSDNLSLDKDARVADKPNKISSRFDSKSPQNTLPLDSEAKPPSENLAIDIGSIKPHLLGGELIIEFALRNKTSPELQNGFVWGIAVYVDAAGKEHYLSAPQSLKLNGKSELANIRQGYAYSIRHYKLTNFSFPPPLTRKGRFVSAKIFVDNSSGQQGVFDVDLTALREAPNEAALKARAPGQTPPTAKAAASNATNSAIADSEDDLVPEENSGEARGESPAPSALDDGIE